MRVFGVNGSGRGSLDQRLPSSSRPSVPSIKFQHNQYVDFIGRGGVLVSFISKLSFRRPFLIRYVSSIYAASITHTHNQGTIFLSPSGRFSLSRPKHPHIYLGLDHQMAIHASLGPSHPWYSYRRRSHPRLPAPPTTHGALQVGQAPPPSPGPLLH